MGFIVGILPLDVLPITLSPEMKSYVQPAVVYSFIVGFVVYFALAKAGLQSKTVAMPKAVSAAASRWRLTTRSSRS